MSRYPDLSQQPGQAPKSAMRTTYDRSLLVNAPSLTRADRQEGYNIDILDRGSYGQPQPQSATGRIRINLDAAPPPSSASGYAYGNGRYNDSGATLGVPPALPSFDQTPSYNNSNNSSSNRIGDSEKGWSAPPPLLTDPYSTNGGGYGNKLPFWRTKKGMIIIFVSIILVVGIVAGIVAGVVSQKKNKEDAAPASASAPVNGGNDDSISKPLDDVVDTDTREAIITAPTTTAPLASFPPSRPTPGNNSPVVVPPVVEDPIVAPPVVTPPIVTPPVVAPPVGGGNGNGGGGAGGSDPVVPTRPPICASFPNIPACQ